MRKLIYSMGVSLDGYTVGPDGRFDWSTPDEELHRFHNEQTAELGAHLLGRRLYEAMLPWETEEQPDEMRGEFAERLDLDREGGVLEDADRGAGQRAAGHGRHRQGGRPPP